MPKKPQQSESNGQGGLSREDRKNEQIMRMIERAEKQAKKKEEKKKLAVLNKAAVKQGVVGRKAKKMSQLSPMQTQIAINIQFSDKVRANNSTNRYFFERKQTIEEKQRLEQEEWWLRYATHTLHMQQQQQNQRQAQVSSSSSQHAHHNPTTTQQSQQIPPMHANAQSSAVSGDLYYYPNGTTSQQPTQLNGLLAPLGGQQPLSAASLGVGTNTSNAVVQQKSPSYLNAGETGGNYEAGNEEHSGSSYFSSASKRQGLLQASLAQASSEVQQQPSRIVSEPVMPGGNAALAPRRNNDEPASVSLHPLLCPAAPQQSLNSVLNGLQKSKSNGSSILHEEVKESGRGAVGQANRPGGVQINVKLNGPTKNGTNGKGLGMQPSEVPTAVSVHRSQDQEETAEQIIMQLTQKMMGKAKRD